MGLITRALTRIEQPEIIRAPRSSPKNVQAISTAMAVYPYQGRVAVPNARLYRHWSKVSEWVRGAINIRRAQIASADWDIVPFDQTKPYAKRQQARIRELFQTPNPANDSFRTFIEPIIEDLIALDAGCVEKVRSLDGEIREMWPVDGATIRVNALWDGDPNETRYYWYPSGLESQATWKNRDFIYMMANRRTDWPIGMSPLETLRLTIEAEMDAHEYNRRQVKGAAPDGIFDLGEGMTRDQIISFRSFFESEVAGRSALGFIGGTKNAKFIDVRKSNRDQQFLEWQIYLVRKIAVVLGLTPQDLGITFDVNKSTAETQIQISEDRGLRPLMSLLQEYVTEEVVWDEGFGGPANNLAFRFTALNLKESTAKAAIYEKALAGVPWRHINEARLDEGREPIKEMEGKLIMSTPQGALDISDVPTVREFLEMQYGNRNQPEPTPPQKSVDVNVAATDLGPFYDAIKVISEATGVREKALLEAINKPQPPTEVHIDKGAVDVNLSPVITIPSSPPRSVKRESQFITDPEGRIVGKTETETEQ